MIDADPSSEGTVVADIPQKHVEDEPRFSPAQRVRPATQTKAARLHFITEAVRAEGHVSVDDLTAALHVSRMTIHRDLDDLQHDRVLRKVRGGASAERTTNFESDFHYRANAVREEKRAIARAAARFAHDGDVVIIGESSTTGHLVPFLDHLENLTVITNFLPIMEEVGRMRDASLIALGGVFDPRYQAFFGLQCEQALRHLYADVLFASSSALLGTDVYHQDEPVVKVKQAMMRSAKTRVLLVDHTKFGHGALNHVGAVTDFDAIIVDDRVARDDVTALEASGVRVVIASLAGS